MTARAWLIALPLGLLTTGLFIAALAAGWDAAQRHALPVLHRSIAP